MCTLLWVVLVKVLSYVDVLLPSIIGCLTTSTFEVIDAVKWETVYVLLSLEESIQSNYRVLIPLVINYLIPCQQALVRGPAMLYYTMICCGKYGLGAQVFFGVYTGLDCQYGTQFPVGLCFITMQASVISKHFGHDIKFIIIYRGWVLKYWR